MSFPSLPRAPSARRGRGWCGCLKHRAHALCYSMPPLPGLVGNRKAFGQIGQKQIGQIHFCIVFSALSLNYIPKIKTRKSTKNLVVSKFYCTFAAKVSNMGKLAFLLCFILSVYPADVNENRRHIHVVRRGSKKSHRGNTVAKKG